MHRKNAQDQKRAKLFTKIIREVTVAASAGLIDPQFNPRLRLAIIAAKEANLPKDRVEAAIKKSSAGYENGQYEEFRYEGYGSGGVALIIETLSDNKNRTASEVRAAFNKFAGTLAESGSVSYMFQRQGVITYPLSSGSAEEILALALESEVEECESGQEHEIYCSFDRFHSVREYLERAIGEPSSAKLIWRPSVMNSPGHDSVKSVLKLIEALEDLDDVQNVWSNLEISEDFEDNLSC